MCREGVWHGSGALRLHEPALDALQALRDRLGKPLIVRSVYGSPTHNGAVGGAPRSYITPGDTIKWLPRQVSLAA